MGRMTENTFKVLYEYGKAVYDGKININEAGEKAHEADSEVSSNSAVHYIKWYSKMVVGEILTWNSNPQLLVYYVKRLVEEASPDTAALAIKAVRTYIRYYSKRKNSEEKETELASIANQNNIELLPIDIADEHIGFGDVIEVDDMDDVSGLLHNISDYIASKGFTYPSSLIENFYLSLKSKPFVILAGTSGTGKTRLVRLFAEAVGAEYKLIPVRPDWSDGSDLFGHRDLNGNFVEGPVCECFKMAQEHPEKPIIMCLDEMNLARVEYYFSDFLSVMESRERVNDRIVTDGIAQYHQGIPDNLYVVGTVNMDETTFPFSRKVLDRANTIEFSYVDMMPDFSGASGGATRMNVPNSFLISEYLVLASDCKPEDQNYVSDICLKLQEINQVLEKANAHVGYRVRDEIVFYMLHNRLAGQLFSDEDAMDNAIMQKILPRLQGSSISVKDMLGELFGICVKGKAGSMKEVSYEQMQAELKDGKGIYPNSAKKLVAMVRRFEEDGFVSYWS